MRFEPLQKIYYAETWACNLMQPHSRVATYIHSCMHAYVPPYLHTSVPPYLLYILCILYILYHTVHTYVRNQLINAVNACMPTCTHAHHTVQYNTTQHNTTEYNTIQQYMTLYMHLHANQLTEVQYIGVHLYVFVLFGYPDVFCTGCQAAGYLQASSASTQL